MKKMKGERKLDYLSFTLKDVKFPGLVMQDLGVDFTAVPGGRHGYSKMALADEGGVSVMWDGVVKNMGVHVQVSGQGCQLLQRTDGFTSWQDFLNSWLDQNAKFTRLDLAIDDISGCIPFERVHGQIQAGTAMTRVKNGSYQMKWDAEHRYQTLYVGKRGSHTMMRCYDKGLQLGGNESWLRFEFEYRHEKAHGVANLLSSEGWDAAAGVARSFIEFKDEKHRTSDKSRQRAAKWWVELIDASKHVVKIERNRETSLAKAYGWLQRHAAPIIATLAEYEGGDIGFMVDLAVEGKKRCREKHAKMLREGLIPKGAY